MRTRLSLYNTISAILLQLVNLITIFILQKVIIIEYGSAVNGLVSSVRQLISYITLVEAGLAGAAIYALYKPLAEKDTDRTNRILSAANRFYNISGFIFSTIILLSTFIYPLFVSKQGINYFTIAALVVIIGFSGALEFFAMGRYRVLFTADQKSYVISIINAITILLNSLIIYVLSKLHYDIVIVQFFSLTGFLARSILFSLYAKRRYHALSFKAEPDTKALDKRWDSLILQILGVVTTGTPIIVITFFCGLREVSVFIIFNMVFASVMALLTTFNNGLSAIFGDLLARKEMEIFQKAYKLYEYLYYGLLGWGYACAAILIMPFIRIYTVSFTDANYIRPEIAVLFVLSGLLFNIKTPHGMLVISAGLYKETKYQTLTQAIINIVVSVALAPFFGMAGVLIGSVVSNIYRDIDLIFYIPKAVTRLSPVLTIKRILRMLVLTAICIVPTMTLIDVNPGNYFSWLFWAVLTALWCFSVFTFGNAIMEQNTTRQVLERFRGLLKKAG